MHSFYIAFCVVFQLVGWSTLIVSATQLYKDRAKLHKLFIAPRSFKTRRVHRVCSFVGSLFVVVASIDFYGTFGIYPTYVRVTLYSISHTPITLSVGMEIFQELMVALSFLAVDRKRWEGPVRIVLASFLACNTSLYNISFYFDNRALLTAMRVSVIFSCFFVMLVCNAMFAMLWKHEQNLVKCGLQRKSKKSGNSHNLVRHWRIYAALTTFVFGTAGVTLLIDAIKAPSTQSRNNVNVYVNSDTLPSLHAIGSPLATLCTYAMLTWRGYLRKSEAASNDRRLQSNTARVSSKQTVSYDATATARQSPAAVDDVVVEVARSGAVPTTGDHENSELASHTMSASDDIAKTAATTGDVIASSV